MRDLKRLFQPRSIAVIGGGAWCESVVEQCEKMGFQGFVWPVHPSKSEIAGIKSFPSLSALPAAPDAAFIGINRHATIEAVRALRALNAGGAVCFASGFREAQAETGDGNTLQDALLQAAGDMPIIGPNCYGFINYLDGALLWPDQHGGQRCQRGVAMLTQSSNMAINLSMQARALPVAYIATAGNQAQVGLSEVGSALLQDSRVTALGLHIEGIGDISAFEQLANTAAKLSKPVVALKAGKSEQAQAAAISHTASLAGSDAGARALLKRLRVAQVDSLPAFLETLKLLHHAGPLPSNAIVSMSCSGGEASLMADCAADRNIAFPALSDDQNQRLRDLLGPMVSLANPLDYHTFIWNDAPRMAEVFKAMLGGKADLGCVIADFPRADRCDPAAWMCLIEAGAATVKTTRKPLAFVSTLPETLPEPISKLAVEAGIVPLQGLDDALTAIEAASFLGAEAARAQPILAPGSPVNARVLSEAEAKSALAEHGLHVPMSKRACSPDGLARVLKNLAYPVVLKTTDIAHKTEAGGVALGLRSEAEVLERAAKMPGPGFLVEEMVEDAVVELLVGVVRDPAHGFVLTLGIGGTWTELLADTTALLLPCTKQEIEAALASLRVSPVLKGYRGQPAANIGAIVNAVLAVQSYVKAHAQSLEEVEINPLICTATDAIAVDALIRIGDPQ